MNAAAVIRVAAGSGTAPSMLQHFFETVCMCFLSVARLGKGSFARRIRPFEVFLLADEVEYFAEKTLEGSHGLDEKPSESQSYCC